MFDMHPYMNLRGVVFTEMGGCVCVCVRSRPLQTAKRKRGYIKNKLSLKKGKKLTRKSL